MGNRYGLDGNLELWVREVSPDWPPRRIVAANSEGRVYNIFLERDFPHDAKPGKPIYLNMKTTGFQTRTDSITGKPMTLLEFCVWGVAPEGEFKIILSGYPGLPSGKAYCLEPTDVLLNSILPCDSVLV